MISPLAASKSKQSSIDKATSCTFALNATLIVLGFHKKRNSTFPPSEASPGLLVKARLPIVLTEAGITMEVSLLDSNATSPIYVRESGSVRDEI